MTRGGHIRPITFLTFSFQPVHTLAIHVTLDDSYRISYSSRAAFAALGGGFLHLRKDGGRLWRWRYARSSSSTVGREGVGSNHSNEPVTSCENPTIQLQIYLHMKTYAELHMLQCCRCYSTIVASIIATVSQG